MCDSSQFHSFWWKLGFKLLHKITLEEKGEDPFLESTHYLKYFKYELSIVPMHNKVKSRLEVKSTREEGLGFWTTKNGRGYQTKATWVTPMNLNLDKTNSIYTKKMILINWDNTINRNKRNNNDHSSDFHYTIIVK